MSMLLVLSIVTVLVGGVLTVYNFNKARLPFMFSFLLLMVGLSLLFSYTSVN